jgi:hypothetical protein
MFRRFRSFCGSRPLWAFVPQISSASSSPANGLEVNPRGQGPRAEAAAARRLPAFEARDAGGVTPRKLR